MLEKIMESCYLDEFIDCFPNNPVIIPKITEHTYATHRGILSRTNISTVFSVNNRCVIKVVEVFLGIDVTGNVSGHLKDLKGRNLSTMPLTYMPTWKSGITYEGNNVAPPTFSDIVILVPGRDYVIDMDFSFDTNENEPIEYQTLADIPEMPHTVDTAEGLSVTFKNYSPLIHTIRFIMV